MFVFANIKFLYLLIIIPLMIVLYIIVQTRQRKRLIKFGNIEMLKGLMPNVSGYRPHVKFVLLMLAVALMIIALARPQMLKNKRMSRNAVSRLCSCSIYRIR